MFIGIEENTDLYNHNTKIKKLQTEKAALKWLESWDNPYAYPGAADENLPVPQQNWHRRIRSVVETPKHFRLSKKEVKKEYGSWKDSSYYKDEDDCKASVYRNHAVRKVKIPD